MKLVILFVVLGLAAHADDFEDLTVSLKKNRQGQMQLCNKPFLSKQKPQCLAISPVQGGKLESDDNSIAITELNLDDLGLQPQGAQTLFGAVVRWKGNGADPLGITGPQGRLFALGSLVNGKVQIDEFSDEGVSQQLDRRILFGETDTLRLHAKTSLWLESVLKPAVEKALAPPALH